jgi:hypothetical protein
MAAVNDLFGTIYIKGQVLFQQAPTAIPCLSSSPGLLN